MSFDNEAGMFPMELTAPNAPTQGIFGTQCEDSSNLLVQTIQEPQLVDFSSSFHDSCSSFSCSSSLALGSMSSGQFSFSPSLSSYDSESPYPSFASIPPQSNHRNTATSYLSLQLHAHHIQPVPGHQISASPVSAQSMIDAVGVHHPRSPHALPLYASGEPLERASNPDQEQLLSLGFENENAQMLSPMISSPTQDAFSFGYENAMVGSLPMNIPHAHQHHQTRQYRAKAHPYTRTQPGGSLSLSDVGPMMNTLPISSGFSYPSPPALRSFNEVASANAGFTVDQLKAANAILDWIPQNPNKVIPATLISQDLIEVSEGHGWCLIGNCSVERARLRSDPTYDPKTDTTYRKRLDHLYDHVRDKHFNHRPFRCSLCDHRFSREHDLRRHEATHSQWSQVDCPYCSKVYTRKDNLRRHIIRKHSKPQSQSAPTQSTLQFSLPSQASS